MLDKVELPVDCHGRNAWEIAKVVAESAGEILMKWWRSGSLGSSIERKMFGGLRSR